MHLVGFYYKNNLGMFYFGVLMHVCIILTLRGQSLVIW